MHTANSNSLEARKQRWCDFLDLTKPPSLLYLIHYDPDPVPPPKPWPQLKEERIAWALREYERQREQMEWLRDDSIPFINPYTGTEILAEAMGCRVHRPEDNNPFALPLIHSAREVSRVRVPKLEETPLMLLFEIADELRRRAGPEAVMKLVDIQSPMDIAALIWDKNNFYVGIYDAPEAVKELAAKVKELFFAFNDAWFARYGREFIAHYPAYYMPQGLTLSEDEVGSVNSAMFEEFYLPELVEISQRYGGLGMHCCANARHQWANFKRIPHLRLLNLVQPAEILREAWSYFAHHVAQMHSWSGDGPAWTWPQQYPAGARIVIQVEAKTRDEALELADRLWVACGRAN